MPKGMMWGAGSGKRTKLQKLDLTRLRSVHDLVERATCERRDHLNDVFGSTGLREVNFAVGVT